MARILALDLGGSRTGFAITDEEKIIAQAMPFTVPARELPEKIQELFKEYAFEKVLIGLPLTLTGESGRQVLYVKSLVEKIKSSINCPIEYIDERLSTAHAESLPQVEDIPIDSLVAQQLLESYLQKIKNQTNESIPTR